MKKFSNIPKHRHQGFTLVELMVAIALFSILVAVAVGGFTRALRSERQAGDIIAAESNVSLALEQMAREVRTGSDFCPTTVSGNLCGDPSVDAATGVADVYPNLAFTNAEGAVVVYALQDSVLMKSVDGGSTFSPVTADTVSVPYFAAEIAGNSAGDHWPPRVTIDLGIVPNDPSLAGQILHLQTTVSARAIDCDAGGNC